MTRRGRPSGSLGPESLATLALASTRTVTFLDVHAELQLSRAHAKETVRQGRRDGWLVVVGTERSPGAMRPVMRVRAAQALPAMHTLDDLSSWPHRLRSTP
jgi:hypothetical protein